jgi:SAM-dependent methyltransferase
VDPEPFKQIARMLWSLGDYTAIAERFQEAARELVDACKARPGIQLLDVAAGDGNVAIAAAWRGASVTASDLTPAMVELGRKRSASEGVEIEWQEADVEALPFEDNTFDVVASAFGVMFAPRPEVAASEMFRVARPGGTIGMVNWTTEGFIARQVEWMDKYTPPRPPGVPSPMSWGDPTVVEQRLGPLAASISCELKTARFTFASEDELQTFFENNLGPVVALKNILPEEKYQEMLAGYRQIITELNQSDDAAVVESQYLLVTAEKPPG